MATHLALEPQIMPWEYWRPSLTMAGCIVVYVLEEEGMEGGGGGDSRSEGRAPGTGPHVVGLGGYPLSCSA